MDFYPPRPGARPLRAAPRGRTGWRKGSLAGLLAGGLAVTFLTALGPAITARALEGPGETSDPPAPVVSYKEIRHPRQKTYIKRTWGVEVMDVRLIAAGHGLEFRYKVLDAEKAAPLFERRTKPVLTHAETGHKLLVPTPAKVGALRNSNSPIEGRIYWMYFATPGNLVKQGDHVSIEIGEFRVDGLIVQ